ncbi:MAG TPA: PIN domain-containing protein [Thermoanaerobaculia bacterium]|nr:PIN domain-containing protein [Thermoanaerobaculia bacterium]
MATVKPFFFDTTVLLGGLIEFSPDAAEQAVFDAVAAGRIREPQTAWHCCLEFFAVATRLPPAYRLAPAEAVSLLQDEVFPRLAIHQLTASALKSFLDAAVKDRVVGGRVYDAHIAEIARRSGAGTIVTGNRRHFTTLLAHGIRVLTAEEFAEDLGL